jgi:hypothetical protein
MPKFTKLISCDRLEDSTVACFLADDGRSYVAEFPHDVRKLCCVNCKRQLLAKRRTYGASAIVAIVASISRATNSACTCASKTAPGSWQFSIRLYSWSNLGPSCPDKLTISICALRLIVEENHLCACRSLRQRLELTKAKRKQAPGKPLS